MHEALLKLRHHLATRWVGMIWHNKHLVVFPNGIPPFPHGVMAAHGSLEPFVLVRVQVGELPRRVLAEKREPVAPGRLDRRPGSHHKRARPNGPVRFAFFTSFRLPVPRAEKWQS